MTASIAVFPVSRSKLVLEREVAEIVQLVALGREHEALDLWREIADRSERHLRRGGVPQSALQEARSRFARDTEAEVDRRLRPRAAK